jgi:hypothetical protein
MGSSGHLVEAKLSPGGFLPVRQAQRVPWPWGNMESRTSVVDAVRLDAFCDALNFFAL